ncbi:DUF1320 domain-containing protein [Desulfovibrio sp. OttesenSCG-928-G15]|nr:DUF1320 domain-containing protein [Desulfovibrio sp. OttesenSCG-928-G15]
MLLATPEDMRAAFGHEEFDALSQPHSYAHQADTEPDEAAALAVITKALTEASETAASYLVGRYPIFRQAEAPQGFALPKCLTRAVCDIARYYLTGAGTFETEAIDRRYKLALVWLKEIAQGVADLPLAPTPEEEATGSGSVMFCPGTREWAQSASATEDE